MSMELEKWYQVDVLAEQAGGYFSVPSAAELAYTDLFFSVCEQFGIRYYSATPKERYFVEEVTHVTWACQHKQAQERKQPSTQLCMKTLAKQT